jgi:hypothetical protein
MERGRVEEIMVDVSKFAQIWERVGEEFFLLTQERLRIRFRHKEGCVGGPSDLEILVVPTAVSYMGWGATYDKHLLVCPYCKRKKEFRNV